jgi:hypothetical protein
MSNHFDPNQPRVPAGHDGGGQWTDADHPAPGVGKPDISPRGRLYDAVVGQGDSGLNTRLALLDESQLRRSPGPTSLPRIRVTPASRIVGAVVRLSPAGRAALIAYTILSLLNDRKRQAVISFKAKEFRRVGPDRTFDPEILTTVDREDVKKVCGDKMFDKIQNIVDQAYDDVLKEGKILSPTQFGIEVHKRIKDAILALGDDNITAELSLPKPESQSNKDHYGAKDTARLDIFNRIDKNTVCTYEVKTRPSGTTRRQMRNYVTSVAKKYPEVDRIIFTEMRPTSAPVPKPKATLKDE